MLLCPVRDCHLELLRAERRLVCPRRHSFDVARSGYINLLQPQDRRSRHPGDSAEAVAARRRLHDRGVTAPLAQAIGAILAASPSDCVLDAGCGDGFYLGTLAGQIGFAGRGVDISIPAITAAAKRYPQCEWVVANADRFLPYPDASFSAVLSITARMNPGEFRRVLREDGRLLIALAAPDDLIELRGVPARGAKSQDKGRDRVPRTVQEFASYFRLIDRRRATTQADLDSATVEDVLVSIYRPFPSRGLQKKRSHSPQATRCTFSLDLLLFQPL